MLASLHVRSRASITGPSSAVSRSLRPRAAVSAPGTRAPKAAMPVLQHSWDESPQGSCFSSGDVKMQVLLPQAGTWLVLDLAKDTALARDSFADAAAGAIYVKVSAIRMELQTRLSMFNGKEIVIHKCSAEQGVGGELTDDNSVYHLTWLVAETRESQTVSEDYIKPEPRLKWNYRPPQDPISHSLQVLLFIEPTMTWSEVFIPDFSAFTKGAVASTISDLKLVILSAFDPVTVNGYNLKFTPDDLEIRTCSGSHAQGSPLVDGTRVVNGKWYYVTMDGLLKQLEWADSANDDVQ